MSETVSLLNNWAYALGQPRSVADLKAKPEDFIVNEVLGFEPAGEGEHIYLQIKKRGQNTQWVAKKLAEALAIKPRDIGYAGLKDRHAVTQQWFSIYWPKPTFPVFESIVIDEVQLSGFTRHTQKLRPGMHAGNRFMICLHDMSDVDDSLQRCKVIADVGAPNYFGEQRFGIDGQNLQLARTLLIDRKIQKKRGDKDKGFAISAARSLVFNTVLSYRVQCNNWSAVLNGDTATEMPTGPMWGRGRSLSDGETAALEETALKELGEWRHALEHAGVQQERRPLVVKPASFEYSADGGTLQLSFMLKQGEYATSVLREIAQTRNR